MRNEQRATGNRHPQSPLLIHKGRGLAIRGAGCRLPAAHFTLGAVLVQGQPAVRSDSRSSSAPRLHRSATSEPSESRPFMTSFIESRSAFEILSHEPYSRSAVFISTHSGMLSSAPVPVPLSPPSPLGSAGATPPSAGTSLLWRSVNALSAIA